jgi:hypothetical protein
LWLTRGLHQGCGLSPYLFNIFINDIIGYIDTEETRSPMIKELRTSGFLFVDDLAVGLQKKIALVDQYCKNLNLKCNLNKLKIVVIKKREKLKATERWRVNGQNTEVVDKFNCIGVTLSCQLFHMVVKVGHSH